MSAEPGERPTRDPARIARIADKLTRAWALYPDLRLGQLVANLAGALDVFSVEDELLEAALDEFLAKPPYVEVSLLDAPAYARREHPDEHAQFARRTGAELAARLADQGECPDDPR